MPCKLCLSSSVEFYHQDKVRDYWQCQKCQLVFVNPEQYLSEKDEKFIYDQHQNSPDDQGYRQFLNKLLIPLAKKLPKKATGLDFGSGPGPTVSVIMHDQGFNVENYDIFYANNPDLLKSTYDFVTCTEVIEHLFSPNVVISELTSLLKPKGLLGIMTKRVSDKESFKNWHYKNDPTHVCFYSVDTFKYIASHWNYDLTIISSDSLLLQKI